MKTKDVATPGGSFFDGMEVAVIRLTSSRSQLTLRSGPLPSKYEIKSAFSIGHTPESTVLGTISCEVTSRYDDSPEAAITIFCEFQAVYRRSDGTMPTIEEISSHKEEITQSATFQLWPFVRHYVYWVSAQLGIPSLTLPLYKPAFAGDGDSVQQGASVAKRKAVKKVKRPKSR